MSKFISPKDFAMAILPSNAELVSKLTELENELNVVSRGAPDHSKARKYIDHIANDQGVSAAQIEKAVALLRTYKKLE
ncbi:hypothetical protein ACSFBX_11230 [Variovorax sp. RB2P76]|uniref:hypothetical protein n=1 Tax=Variovorax sp. RB2P76 TaxID=3443736 RepID=UPI003F453998